MAEDKAFDWAKLDVGGTPASQPPRETVVVHCVNGHRLVVPAALAGKWGKCSKCRAAFQIPPPGSAAAAHPPPPADVPAATPSESPVAASADVEPDAFVGVAGATAAAGSPHVPPPPSLPPTVNAPEPPNAEALQPPAPAAVSIGDLVGRLWREVELGGIIEVHLSGGSVILPKWFEPRWSRGSHGLFASQAADGSVTLTAVAWDSIQKIVVRNVEGLPDDMFHEAAAE